MVRLVGHRRNLWHLRLQFEWLPFEQESYLCADRVANESADAAAAADVAGTVEIAPDQFANSGGDARRRPVQIMVVSCDSRDSRLRFPCVCA